MLGVDGTQWRWYSAERCSRLAPRSYAGRCEPVSVLLVSINERHKKHRTTYLLRAMFPQCAFT